MSKNFWTSTSAPQQFKTLPPARPHNACRDPKRHEILRAYMWEYRDRVCLWCDPEHANAWGYIDEECLCQEQRVLVQKLHEEEQQKEKRA